MSSFLLVVLPQVLSVPQMWQLLSVCRLQVVSALPLPCRDSVRSFPVGAEFPLGGVSSSAHDFPQDEISNLEVSVSDPGIVVLHHAVLVPYEPLFCCLPDFVYQIELQTYGLVVPAFIMVVYPVAYKSDLDQDDCLISVRQPKQCLSCGCSRRRSVCPQYAQQFFRPYALYPLKPSLDNLEQGFIHNFDLSVKFGGGRGRSSGSLSLTTSKSPGMSRC